MTKKEIIEKIAGAAEALEAAMRKVADDAQPKRLRLNAEETIELMKDHMDEFAVQIVRGYVEHEDPIYRNLSEDGDDAPDFDVYIVWKAKILQNWKYLLSTTMEDRMYYELTYNGCKREWYLDAYIKQANVVMTVGNAEAVDDGE